ncbi:hypothetical protein COU38_03360 [Candidatus Micrarchaeota archaeon CG10_big_fil_rev_8_21_14_0_10_54_18]|nr:MAG: hypothetical protein AUJ15_02475 [Candidatus Micrarchaeota archaeon CG1_02_55_41]PIO03862.1 MAG: hypothetical protein COT57_00290 [Candidatus Micrarchaeota archaeon CG09_land_8_20_14_0_10_55_25]PJD00987.1 MAG: hypothetical protein COU38_03360 [Candidatus Micrarchaeota archaeon CG10_big_fil_rev_8_21_14_0_10_54_18]
MQYSRTGAGSILFGALILAAAWWLGWSSAPLNEAVTAMLLTAAAGGVILFGLFLFVAGLLLFFI